MKPCADVLIAYLRAEDTLVLQITYKVVVHLRGDKSRGNLWGAVLIAKAKGESASLTQVECSVELTST